MCNGSKYQPRGRSSALSVKCYVLECVSKSFDKFWKIQNSEVSYSTRENTRVRGSDENCQHMGAFMQGHEDLT